MTDDIQRILDQALAPREQPAEIIVTCNDRHSLRTVARFTEYSARKWKLVEPRYEQSSPDEAIRHLSKRSAAADILIGSELVQQRDSPDGATRLRYTLECKLCGRRTVVRSERLWPVLDVLRHAGLDSITLTALAARV